MSKERDLVLLEKSIISKINDIRTLKVTAKDSGIGKLINLLKPLDEPLYDKILIMYKEVLKNLI